MTPITQTITTVPGGNCFSTCIASILEMDLADVPNFCLDPDWYRETTKWLNARGYTLFEIKITADTEWFHAAHDGPFVIVSGQSPRGEHKHSIVGQLGFGEIRYVHDPHPAGGWIVMDPEYIGLIIPLHGVN